MKKDRSHLFSGTGSFSGGIRDIEHLPIANAASRLHRPSIVRGIGAKDMNWRLEKKASPWENELYHPETSNISSSERQLKLSEQSQMAAALTIF